MIPKCTCGGEAECVRDLAGWLVCCMATHHNCPASTAIYSTPGAALAAWTRMVAPPTVEEVRVTIENITYVEEEGGIYFVGNIDEAARAVLALWEGRDG